MREKKWFPVVYMFLATAFFSSVVIGFTRLTRNRVAANEALALERAVVHVWPQTRAKAANAAMVHQLFVEQATLPDEATGGAYTLRRHQGGTVAAYALPIAGQGFWAPIKGVIGIAADRKTITGIAFYEQNETPGLGAEIAQVPFCRQFEGKVMAPGQTPIRIRRPTVHLSENEVHAVTGATQTCTRLERIICQALQQWQEQMAYRVHKKDNEQVP